ncbi:hypothetical protein XarbCFBP8142_02170 [Xanthomonas arboricola]|nr:hypothetical protein XarbCFBP8142_02170 [Xanthomonas arboricola]
MRRFFMLRSAKVPLPSGQAGTACAPRARPGLSLSGFGGRQQRGRRSAARLGQTSCLTHRRGTSLCRFPPIPGRAAAAHRSRFFHAQVCESPSPVGASRHSLRATSAAWPVA